MSPNAPFLCHVVREPHHPMGAGDRPDGNPRQFIILELLGPADDIARAQNTIVRNGQVRVEPVLPLKAR